VQAHYAGFSKKKAEYNRSGILKGRQLLFTKPDTASSAAATLAAGSVIEIRNLHMDSGLSCQKECNWLEVMTLQGNSGWIPEKSVLFMPLTGR
jgi:hypothetical protein